MIEWLSQPGAQAVRRAWNSFVASSTPVLLTGPAGTGKSLFLSLFRDEAPGSVVVLSSTGISALQIGGQTVHTFFRLPPRVLLREDADQTSRLDVYAAADFIVIDEASMVRADVIDTVDRLLRRARGSHAPFGGVRLRLVGDPYQLAPVATSHDTEALHALGYDGAWFFQAHAFQDTPLEVVALDQIHRQSSQDFAALLSRIRKGMLCPADLSLLAKRVAAGAARTSRPALTLTPTRKAAERENDRLLDALPGASAVYRGRIDGDFPAKELPVPLHLRLRVGARVIMVKNDPFRRWVNGTTGTVVACGQGRILVRPDHGNAVHDVEPVMWERIRYQIRSKGEPVVPQVVGRYVQIPAVLGWAATIHRSQGMTIDRVRVQLGAGAFSAGQTYVALSRVTTLDGLQLSRQVHPDDVWVDSAVATFLGEQ